ncbi:MAG: protease modulator HflK, partial [Gemmatimonadetes bacterium]|nr:protease modulator HflK [Gemmatimonadota bacterium]
MAWNEPGGNKNPWDRRPGQGPPDLDDIVRNWQRRLAALFGGGPGGRAPATRGPRLNWGAIALLLVAVWGATGFYQVDAAERGVVTRFGRYTETTNEGLRWHWPWPVEAVQIVNIAKNDSIDDKTRMLTADENLVDIS